MKYLIALVSLFMCGNVIAKDTVNIVVHEIAPMVIEDTNGNFSGFDIDMMNKITADLGVVPNYFSVNTLSEVFTAIDNGDAEFGVAGITIRHNRALKYDFSYPYKKSGLSVLIRDEYEMSTFGAIITLIGSKNFIRTWLTFLIFFLVAAHIIWLTERGSDSIADPYLDKDVDESGIEESAWFLVAVITTIGWGDITVKKRLSRVAVVLTAVVGFTLFASLMGQFSAISEAQMQTYAINGVDDLRGKKVAVVGGTTSELDDIGAKITKANTVEEAVLQLEARRVDAVVFDAPTLQYYAKENDAFTTVGGMFDLQDYGIVMKKGHPLRDSVSMKVLSLIESDLYENSQQKWFGQND